jgi:hypothetical protein
MERKGQHRIPVSFTKAEIEVSLHKAIEDRAAELGLKNAEYLKCLAREDLKKSKIVRWRD